MNCSNKKAGIFDIFLWMIVAFVLLAVLIVLSFGFNMFTEKILGTTNFNIGNTTFNSLMSSSIGRVNTAQVNYVPILAFTIIMTLGFAICVYNFFVKSHPLFFFLYILLIGIAFVVSVMISNAYEEFIQDTPVLADTIARFSAGNFIMIHLPLFTTVFGFLGALMLFIGLIRDEGAGGGIVQ